MDFKKFWKTTFTAFVLKNVLVAVAIGLVLLCILISWLRSYTLHGVEVEVPEVTGMFLEEAAPILAAEGLRVEVIDSTYSRKVPLGCIVEQLPPALSHVKPDRVIYVIINASTRRQLPLPDLRDISYRQAEATLRSMGVTVSDTLFEPSEYRDLVLDIRQNGISLEPGSRITEGSSVTMVIGRGKGTAILPTPSLVGLSLTDARSLLLAKYLTLGLVEYDVEPTDANRDEYVVYYQTPTGGTDIQEGSRVDVRLTRDLEHAMMINNSRVDDDEEEFF